MDRRESADPSNYAHLEWSSATAVTKFSDFAFTKFAQLYGSVLIANMSNSSGSFWESTRKSIGQQLLIFSSLPLQTFMKEWVLKSSLNLSVVL